MHLDLDQPTLALESGQVVTLDDARGACIQARMGTVWVTEEGVSEDFVIGPGESRVVSRPGRTLVQAMQSAWISIRTDCNTWHHLH